MTPGRKLRDDWYAALEATPQKRVLVMAVQLPSGAIEVITNTEDLDSKANYYINAYDLEFHLKANPAVKVVGFMVV